MKRRPIQSIRPIAPVLAPFLVAALVAAGLVAVPAPAAAQGDRPPPPDYTRDPGYVDFEALGLTLRDGVDTAPGAPGGDNAGSFRISLYGPILRLVAEATKGEEPGFSELLSKLRAIRADIFSAPDHHEEELRRRTVEAARELEERGWQTVVEVRSGQGDLSFIQTRTRPDGERIFGLAVMFVEPGGSAGYINIVGDVSPEELGRLGRTFDIEPLARLSEETADSTQEEQEEEPR